jgi:predicted RNA-binding protein with PIN domain
MPAENLPAALKRVASFAPGRRAKLAGTQIVSALESDSAFRERLAVQVRTAVPDVAQALDQGAPPAAADPVEVAAVAYLVRPDGWVHVVETATVSVLAARAADVRQESAEQVERLRRQAESLTEELRQARQRHKDEVARLKAENSELRHKLGDTRVKARSAESAAEAATREAGEAQRAAAATAAQAEAEARRLRTRVEELESEAATSRRAERVERDTGTLRARLLLDTLLETAQGLRRELALPAPEGSPADLVEAHVAEQGVQTSSGHGSLGTDDPTMLDAHMIVDGYNVTKTTWPELALEKQRDRLLVGLAPLVARSGAEVTVVFDAAEKKERPLVNRPRGVRVLFSPHGVIADDIIRELVAAEPQGRPVVVVSSDQEVARDVVRAGARAAGASALARLLARS